MTLKILTRTHFGNRRSLTMTPCTATYDPSSSFVYPSDQFKRFFMPVTFSGTPIAHCTRLCRYMILLGSRRLCVAWSTSNSMKVCPLGSGNCLKAMAIDHDVGWLPECRSATVQQSVQGGSSMFLLLSANKLLTSRHLLDWQTRIRFWANSLSSRRQQIKNCINQWLT